MSLSLVQLSSTAWSLATPSCSRNVAKRGALGPFGRGKGPAGPVQGHSQHPGSWAHVEQQSPSRDWESSEPPSASLKSTDAPQI